MIDHLLFDLDGVLVDAADLHYRALNVALRESGGDRAIIGRHEHLTLFNGLTTRQKLDILEEEGRINPGHVEVIWERKQNVTASEAQSCIYPDPVKIQMLDMLADETSEFDALACVSNCIRQNLTMLLERSHLDMFFKTTISNEDAILPKPAPDLYLKAMKCLGVGPERCMAFEDTPKGVYAAQAAGIATVMLDYTEVDYDHVIRAVRARQQVIRQRGHSG